MPKDPMTLFGSLFNVCIDETEAEREVVIDGVLFAVLGIVSSAVTTYLLSLAGILV